MCTKQNHSAHLLNCLKQNVFILSLSNHAVGISHTPYRRRLIAPFTELKQSRARALATGGSAGKRRRK